MQSMLAMTFFDINSFLQMETYLDPLAVNLPG